MAWTEATRSRALAAPRNPHRPGPWSKQKCRPNRTLTLTDAGRATVREYRQRLAIEAIDAGRPGEWVCYTVRTMIGGTRIMWQRRAVTP